MTAGHNALRGSGPGQKPAFCDALARVGCPDRAVCPPNLRITPGDRRDLVHLALLLGHYGPSRSGELIGERDGGDLEEIFKVVQEKCNVLITARDTSWQRFVRGAQECLSGGLVNFQNVDANGDGKITEDEFKRGCESGWVQASKSADSTGGGQTPEQPTTR
jgi:hypothetical protein